jgi:hypothetical protein
MEDTDTLTALISSTESEFRRLEERGETLERARAEIARKTEAAAGDAESLAQLKIETE